MQQIPPNLLTLFSDALAERYTHNQLDSMFRSLGFEGALGSKKDKVLHWLRTAGQPGSPSPVAVVRKIGAELLEGGPSAYAVVDQHIAEANRHIESAIMGFQLVCRDKESVNMTTQSPKVFISHTSADAALVDALVDLLQTGIDGFQHNHVFCTSLEGMKIPEGVSFIEFIKKQLQEPALVIFVITPSYYESAFCLCELGATWAMSHSAFPLLAPPLGYDDLKAVLANTQTRILNDKMGLNALRDRIISRLQLGSGSTGRWETKRDEFLKKLPEILENLAPSTRVPRVDLEDTKARVAELERELEGRDQEIKKVREERDAVAALKDRNEVRALTAPEGEAGTFNELVASAKDAFRGLSRIVWKVLLAAEQDRGFHVGNRWEDEADREAASNDFLTMDNYGNVHINNEDPKIKKCRKAMVAIQQFLDGASDHFKEEFETRHEMRPLVNSERFWKKFFGI